ncbi:glycosyltransferase family 9 protein [Gluconobacter kondonii]|uniref:glycosyltransferase family 9 protein n=1 Tax=Gluconobacter kondonii TaxID=941463 RepID=UPI001B8CF962|nr:glycosyltransferase family 9 protein [Gluconobacter kondonii]MBS1084492.1 glycosyltransferase family 9 protein [Gluconobacter kondonii]
MPLTDFQYDLEKLKNRRLQTYHRGSTSRLSRVVSRYRELSAENYSTPAILLSIARSVMRKIIGRIRRLALSDSFPEIAELKAGQDLTSLTGAVLRKLERGDIGRLQAFAVRITGGLGDALVVARLIRDLQKILGDNLEFDVYSQSPAAVEAFFRNIPAFRKSLNLEIFEHVTRYYMFALSANQFVTFVNEQIDYRAVLTYYPKVVKIFGYAQKKREEIEFYIKNHPYLDGAFSDIATQHGFKRYTYLHEMLGIDYGGDLLPIDVDPKISRGLDLKQKSYITIHDGWDAKFKISTQRPTKAVPKAIWEQIIAGLKAAMPDITIVQLGGKTGDDLPQVDLNLKNRLTFSESTSIIAGAILHVDAESGLVHLAAALGIKSVVMFGPTNVAWFGYPQNINIAPVQCGNCWWSNTTWMDTCALGMTEPVCTTSINPKTVIEATLELLSRETAHAAKASTTA